MTHPHPDPEGSQLTRTVLLRMAGELAASGEPVVDVERAVRSLGRGAGYPDVQVATSPTAVFLSLSAGSAASIAPVRGPLRLDQCAAVHAVRHFLDTGRLTLAQADQELDAIRALPHPYPGWVRHLGLMGVSVGLSLILQPGLPNVAVAALGSVLVSLLMTQAGRHTVLGSLLPSLAAFTAALLAFGAYQLDLLDGPLRTLICPLAVLLPGALLVTGVSELAQGAMVAGASRVFYGMVQLGLFSLGVVGASMVLGVDEGAFANVRVAGPGIWVAPLGLVLITLGLTLAEALPWSLLRWSGLVLVLTFAAQLAGQQSASSLPIGGFTGAVVASFVPSLLSRVREDVPRLVAFLPSFWLLVPGTVGLMGVSQVGVGSGGAATLLGAVGIVASIALGLLIGSALALPLSRPASTWRRRGAQ
ncbi:threonine/serine ThrE exporter family protein [Serinicoccus kebangsaanensis]|uniref:threonine/serine ThrE exporter family protein n=1 Tax=Serinicoccus kebangsaanensis TaxID=2602069 RepID=UPI00124E95D0|nr:threonine/serine exporter family protein [Serinicoccus kebangsaanensis]